MSEVVNFEAIITGSVRRIKIACAKESETVWRATAKVGEDEYTCNDTGTGKTALEAAFRGATMLMFYNFKVEEVVPMGQLSRQELLAMRSVALSALR